MNKFERDSRFLPWLTALLLIVLAAGCGGGGDGGRDAILGSGGVGGAGAIPGAPAGAIAPGAVCTVAAGATIPTVTSSDPTNGNQFAPTSTTGVVGNGKLITATFSLAMNPATIISPTTTFTLTEVGAGAVAGLVSYNASTNVATLTTSAPLKANTSYTAIITTAAMSVGPPTTALACTYAWNFKTAALAAAGPAPVNLGLAGPFGIMATAGMTTAGGIGTVNGNVLLDPLAQCNAQDVDGAGGIGPCLAFRPIINGTVISHFFDPGNTRALIKADLTAAYISIAPPGGQGGTLAGATSLGCDVIGTGGGGGALLGCAGNATIPPGVYIALNSSIGITGTLTLDGGGDSNARFIFQTKTPSTLTTAPGATIILANGAKASNVFWQVGSSATIDTTTTFQGNILASASITLNAGASSCGRMLAGEAAGQLTLGNGVVVSVPGNPSGPAGCQ